MKIINFFKKVYTILILIKNVLFRKKKYTLTFDKDEYSLWYYRFKHWGFDKNNLMMVNGADDICNIFSNLKDSVTVEIIASKKKLKNINNIYYIEYVGEDMSSYKTFKDKYFYGRHYTMSTKTYNYNDIDDRMKKFWICPVTLFVLGRYPNYIYLRY